MCLYIYLFHCLCNCVIVVSLECIYGLFLGLKVIKGPKSRIVPTRPSPKVWVLQKQLCIACGLL